MVLPLLLLLFFSVFEFSRYYYTRITLRHAVREATRFAVTGQVLTDSLGNPITRPASIAKIIMSQAPGLTIDPTSITITPPGGGAPGSIVEVRVNHTYVVLMPLIGAFFPSGSVPIHVSTVMKNERF